jgi:hypothetical protein
MVSVEARLSALEKAVGLPTPTESYGIFWDSDPEDACVGKLTGEQHEEYKCDDGSYFTHFVAFTPEELARFREHGLFPK